MGHGHIIQGLKRFSIGERFIEIRDLYADCFTKIWVEEERMESIFIRSGVKWRSFIPYFI